MCAVNGIFPYLSNAAGLCLSGDQELPNCTQHRQSWDECDAQKDLFSQTAHKGLTADDIYYTLDCVVCAFKRTLSLSITLDLKMSHPVTVSDIVHGQPLTDRKSTFQAHVAEVHSKDEVSM